VSHELRTPLNAIIGFTRLVLRKTEGQIPELQKRELVKGFDQFGAPPEAHQ
jgi:signal transduction histidine kinase